MGNKGKSIPGLFGTIHHYDEHGRKTGTSEPGFFGGYNHYDSNGRSTGHSTPGLFGGYNHRDAHGRPTGHSNPGFLGGYHHNNSEGCYVATCVYGSYDCPQVWTLRRFRDNTLGKKALGRAFIHIYYAISPIIVKWFGKTAWFKKLWRGTLDKMVRRLNDNGVENTPYCDKDWRAH